MAKEIYSIQRYILAKRFFQFLNLNISTISYWYTITFLLNLENIVSTRSSTIAFSSPYNSAAHFLKSVMSSLSNQPQVSKIDTISHNQYLV